MGVQAARVVKVAAADIAPNRRRGGDLRVLLSPRTVGASSGFMGVGTLAPGEYVAEHFHPYSEEFLYVTHGSMLVRAGGEVLELAAGESMMVPIGVRHRMENTGSGPVSVVFHLSPLAPHPSLGHVDCEPLPGEGAPPQVGAAP